MMRCVRFQRDKTPHWSAREENAIDEKVDKNNDNSFQKHDECAIPNHSTPVTSKQNANNVEETLESDCHQSPILLPCTQEGGNEVAWDWSNSLRKTPESRNKKQNVHCETPKGTKLLHKKRNSDSPLLYKPLKRKTIDMENIENMGQFVAELQALTKQINVIKDNDRDHSNNEANKNIPILMDANYNEETSMIEDNKKNSITENNDCNDIIEKKENYDDLFDDSIDDDMIRCTQEMEEKLNMTVAKENSTHTESNVKKEEFSQTSRTDNTSDKNTVQSTSNDNVEEMLIKTIFHTGTNNNNTLKTYSKLASKRNSDSSIHIAGQTDKNFSYNKSCLSNNNATHSSVRNLCDNKKLLKNKATKSFDFPDDSFDDCLATCIDEEKLLPTMFDSLFHRNDCTRSETSYGCLTHAPIKLEANSLKSSTKSEASNAKLPTDKKFFKTKSLSDRYINQNTITNVKSKVNPTRSILHLNPTKTSTITYTSASVSTNPIVRNDSKVENSAIWLTGGTHRTHGSDDVNRCAVKKEDGKENGRFVRHHSTGNMKNDTIQVLKSGSQPAQCTPEEIERKRLQALMKLDAKRKLYAEKKITNNINR